MTLPIGRGEWIIFDTNIVRGPVEGQGDKLDLVEFQKSKGLHPVGLAIGAALELLYWLQHSASDASFARVGSVLEKFGRILDPEFPIAPETPDLAGFAGLGPYPDNRTRADASSLSKVLWRKLQAIRTREDALRPIEVVLPSGRRMTVAPEGGPKGALKRIGDNWIDPLLVPLAKQLAKEDPEYEGLTDAHAKRFFENTKQKAAAWLGLPIHALERLDLQVQMMLRRTRLVTRPEFQPPKKATSNAAVDTALLFYMVLPAVVCTDDGAFVNAVREQRSEDRVRVMLPSELLGWLRSGVLPT